jgi:hypothetical protein
VRRQFENTWPHSRPTTKSGSFFYKSITKKIKYFHTSPHCSNFPCTYVQNPFSKPISITVVPIPRMVWTGNGLPTHRKPLITWRATGLFLSLAFSLRPLRHGSPASFRATAGTALRVIGSTQALANQGSVMLAILLHLKKD